MGVEQLFQEVLEGRALRYMSGACLALALVMVATCLVCLLLNPSFKGALVSALYSRGTSDEDREAANTRVWGFVSLWLVRAVFPLLLVGVVLGSVAKLFPSDDDLKVVGTYRAVKEFGDSAAFNAAMSAFLDSWVVNGILENRYEELQKTEAGCGAVPEEGSEAGQDGQQPVNGADR